MSRGVTGTWIRFPATLFDWQPMRDVSDEELAAYVRLTCWSAINATDGKVPGNTVAQIIGGRQDRVKRLFGRMLKRGLIRPGDPIGHDIYTIVPYDAWQESRNAIERRRERNRRAVARYRMRQKQRRSGGASLATGSSSPADDSQTSESEPA